jgi:hypothetical protein
MFWQGNSVRVKKAKAPPLLLEKWSLLLSSTQAEPWLIGGVPQALVGRLLLSPSHVNEFGVSDRGGGEMAHAD